MEFKLGTLERLYTKMRQDETSSFSVLGSLWNVCFCRAVYFNRVGKELSLCPLSHSARIPLHTYFTVYPQWCFALVEWGVCFELPKVLEGAGRAWILIHLIIVSFMYLFCRSAPASQSGS